jgi:hypothetical protein
VAGLDQCIHRIGAGRGQTGGKYVKRHQSRGST